LPINSRIAKRERERAITVLGGKEMKEKKSREKYEE